MATQIKKNIEYYADGTRTGWQVQLMSIGQGNIGSNLEYRFFMDLLSGNLERDCLPFNSTSIIVPTSRVRWK